MEMNGGFLVTKIKQLGDRIFEKILSEKNIDAFNGAQGRILYVLWATIARVRGSLLAKWKKVKTSWSLRMSLYSGATGSLSFWLLSYRLCL